MIHYEIDYYFKGDWRHTNGESSFPSDQNFITGNYTQADLIDEAYSLVCSVLNFENKTGCVDKNKISCVCSLNPSAPMVNIFEE